MPLTSTFFWQNVSTRLSWCFLLKKSRGMAALPLYVLPNRRNSGDLLQAESYGSYSSSYGCCDTGVDPATLLALIAGIALATYFLRLQIIILMRGKRSTNNIMEVFDELIPPIDFSFDTFEPYVKETALSKTFGPWRSKPVENGNWSRRFKI